MKTGDWPEIVEPWMPIIDKVMESWEADLPARPIFAAMWFVDNVITHVDGGKEEPLSKDWFAGLYKATYAWYRSKYGAALDYHSPNEITAVVEYGGALFQLNVPISASGPMPDPAQQWIEFPEGILESEDPLAWLQATPPLDRMAAAEREAFQKQVSDRAAEVRSICNGLMATRVTPANAMSASVATHVSTAANHILSGGDATLRGLEEIHFAAEKTLKLLLMQEGSPAGKTHDLEALGKTAEQFGIQCSAEIRKMPPWADVNKYRYAEISAPPRTRVLEIYSGGLSIARKAVSRLERENLIAGKRIVIQKPPFARKLQKRE